MRWIVVGLVLLLAVLHQDFWWWADRKYVFGFLPVGLAWHVGISIAASLAWWLAVTVAWPKNLDQVSETPDSTGKPSEAGGH